MQHSPLNRLAIATRQCLTVLVLAFIASTAYATPWLTTQLPTLSTQGGVAYSINNSGVIAGFSYLHDTGGAQVPVLWSGGTVSPLNSGLFGSNSSNDVAEATRITDAGIVFGDIRGVPFMYDGAVHLLPSGSAIQKPQPSVAIDPALFEATYGPTPPGQLRQFLQVAANDFGDVVGTVFTTYLGVGCCNSYGYSSFLYRHEGTVEALPIQFATDINDALSIVGYGGRETPFLLTVDTSITNSVPEPSTGLLVVIGGLGGLVWRKKVSASAQLDSPAI